MFLDSIKKLVRYGRGEDGGKWYIYTINRNERKDDTYGSILRHGSAYVNRGDGKTLFRLEWTIPTHFLHVHFDLDSGDGEYTFGIANKLASMWFSVSSKSAYKSKNDKSLGLSFHDGAIWWRVWTDPHGWDSRTPRWRDGNFNIPNFILGKEQYNSKIIEERNVLIPLPEKTYKGKATLTFDTWTRPNWPYWPFNTQHIRCNIDMNEGEQIPIPGKGENSWDCGEDAIFSRGSGKTSSISQSIGELVTSVLETRLRYGGPNWKPSIEKESAA